MTNRYLKSEELLARAENSIPLGSQTFSKSKVQYPHGVSPFFITKGKGCRVWDVDDNEYIDFVSALASITLGYGDSDVNNAVSEQLKCGSIFSLAHPLEVAVAEKICEMVPSAEKVRFGKNGSDATAASVRLARACTGRDHVAICGYHGWQDWYIGTTPRNLGVPKDTAALSHTFIYNDIDSLVDIYAKFPEKIAAVIMEPMNIEYPKNQFLHRVKELASDNGSLLIFDETITGFRLAAGGAQELFGVTPDLSTFGKGLANGFPLSAVVGLSKYMSSMEDIFFSSTFGGETLSLAAALATLNKIQEQPVLKTIDALGKRLLQGLNEGINRNSLDGLFNTSGVPAWSFLNITPDCGVDPYVARTYIMQELHANGVLSLASHNINYSHTNTEIDFAISVYDRIFSDIAAGDIESKLNCSVLEPIFKVR